MTNTESKFQFLTTEEFSRLTRRERFVYLEAAVAEVERGKARVTRQSLFKDSPPMPAADAAPSEKKL